MRVLDAKHDWLASLRQADDSKVDAVDPKSFDGKDEEKWVGKVGV